MHQLKVLLFSNGRLKLLLCYCASQQHPLTRTNDCICRNKKKRIQNKKYFFSSFSCFVSQRLSFFWISQYVFCFFFCFSQHILENVSQSKTRVEKKGCRALSPGGCLVFSSLNCVQSVCYKVNIQFLFVVVKVTFFHLISVMRWLS